MVAACLMPSAQSDTDSVSLTALWAPRLIFILKSILTGESTDVDIFFISYIDNPHYRNICYLISVSWICFLCTITYCSAARSVLQSTCLSKRGGGIRKLSCPAYWQCSQHREEKNVSHAMWFTFNERAMTQHVCVMWNIECKFSLVVP